MGRGCKGCVASFQINIVTHNINCLTEFSLFGCNEKGNASLFVSDKRNAAHRILFRIIGVKKTLEKIQIGCILKGRIR